MVIAMQNSDGDAQQPTDEPDYRNLFVYAGPEQPDMSVMQVYASGDGELFGHPVRANVIGSSHYISVPGMEYRELTSCRPIQMERGFKPVYRHYLIGEDQGIPQPNDEFDRFIPAGYRANVSISAESHNRRKVFGIEWDVFHEFTGKGPGAPTGIEFNSHGWQTVHCYPEFNIDVWTHTHFSKW